MPQFHDKNFASILRRAESAVTTLSRACRILVVQRSTGNESRRRYGKRVTQDLTPREEQLLGLLAEGYSYEGAGACLYVSVNTVRAHIRSICQKLEVHSKSEAVSKAPRSGTIL